MGEWTKITQEWLKEPQSEMHKDEPFVDRGERLLRAWFSAFKTTDPMHVRIAVGYASDPESDEFLSAIVGVGLDGGELINFRPEEMLRVIDFLKDHRDEHMNDDDGYKEDVTGFIYALEQGVKESTEMFSNKSTRH